MAPDVDHEAVIFEDEGRLVSDVAVYAAEGLRRGERIVLIANAAHAAAIRASLPPDLSPEGQIIVLDAEEALAAIMVGDRPDQARLEALLDSVLVRAGLCRVYGEMVSLLMASGRPGAALELEELWDALSLRHRFRLLCAYDGRSLDQLALRVVREAHGWEGDGSTNSATIATLNASRARLHDRLRRTEQRLQVLAAAGELLDAGFDYEGTLRNVVLGAMPLLADFGFFDVVEGQEVRRIAAAYDNPRAEAILAASRWQASMRRDINLCALSSGETGVHAYIDDDWYRKVATSPEHLDSMRSLGFCSMVTVPLRRRGGVTGALTLFFAGSGRHHTIEDVRLIEELARRSAPAVENARLYEELRVEVRRREEADRRKDEFLAMLGHELRNPLAPVTTALQLMKLRNVPGGERELAIIERQVRHLARLVDDLLDVSRITRGKLQLHRRRFEMSSAVSKAIEMAAPLMDERSHRFTVDVPRTGVPIDGDESRIAQVVANLLTNAAKYTEPGGTITLRVRTEESVAVIECEDTGIGVAPDLQPHLFELFAQGERSIDRSKGGLGLGLALVRSLTEMHAGTATVASPGIGRGTTFTLRLPLAAEGAEVSPAAAPSLDEPPMHAGTGRVLVVDDNDDAAQMLAMALELSGYTVAVAHDGRTAVDVAASFQPAAAIIDIGLPVMDGYAVARELRGRFTGDGLKLIALTGYGQQRDIDAAHEAGFDTHFVKPASIDQLLLALDPSAADAN